MLLKPTAQDGWFFKKKKQLEAECGFFFPPQFSSRAGQTRLAGSYTKLWLTAIKQSKPPRHLSEDGQLVYSLCPLTRQFEVTHTHTQTGNLKPGLPSPFAHGRKRQNTVRFLIRLTPRQCEQVKKLGAFWRREKNLWIKWGRHGCSASIKKTHTAATNNEVIRAYIRSETS